MFNVMPRLFTQTEKAGLNVIKKKLFNNQF